MSIRPGEILSERDKKEFSTLPIRMHFIGVRARVKVNPILALAEIFSPETKIKLDELELKMQQAEELLDEYERTDMSHLVLEQKLKELGFKNDIM